MSDHVILGTVKSVRTVTKSKFTYNGRGISFDGEGLWSFGVVINYHVIFGVDNSSSHTDN